MFKIKAKQVRIKIFLSIFFCLVFASSISLVSYASHNTALLVTGLSNTKAGQKGITWMEKVIKSNEEWSNCKVKYLAYNGERNRGMTATEFSQTITHTFSDCEGKTAIFYYIGHGTDFLGNGDGLKIHEGENFKYKRLLEVLSLVKCKKMVIILDCCRAGGFIELFKTKAGKAAKKRITIITSTSSTQEVKFQDDYYFCFSKVLHQGLNPNSSGKIKADSNQDGTVLASEFVDYVNNKMATQKWEGLKNKKADQTAQYYIGKDNPILFSYSIKTGSSTRSIYEGKSFSFSTKLFGNIVSPEKLTWDLSSKGIVSVKREADKIRITGEKPGKVTLTVKYGKLKSTKNITVKKTSISLDKTSITLKAGSSKTLKATVTGPSLTVRWTSSDKSVAAVSDSGKVTGKGAGTAIITAKANGKTATCKVTIKSEKKVVYVKCAGESTAVILEDGSLWVCGNNTDGKLGVGNPDSNIWGFHKVTDNVCKVDMSYSHMAFIKNDGTLWMCGSSYEGEFGNGDTGVTHEPKKVANQVADVAVALGVSLILKTDGTLWGCGSNSYGQLLDNNFHSYNFTMVKLMDDVKSMTTSNQVTGVIKTDNSCWIFGWLGLGDTQYKEPVNVINGVKSIQAGKGDVFGFIGNDGSARILDRDNHSTIKISENAKQIIANFYLDDEYNHVLLLKNDGTVWAKGYNDEGDLGTGKPAGSTTDSFEKVMTGVKSISSDRATAFLKTDGTLYMCGNTWQMGRDDLNSIQLTPIRIHFD